MAWTGALAVALLVNIFQRKQEARSPYLKLVELTEDDADPKKWGANWPREYDGYQRTAEPTSTKYGGGTIGPEGGLAPQKAVRDPWLPRLFAGYSNMERFGAGWERSTEHADLLSLLPEADGKRAPDLGCGAEG